VYWYEPHGVRLQKLALIREPQRRPEVRHQIILPEDIIHHHTSEAPACNSTAPQWPQQENGPYRQQSLGCLSVHSTCRFVSAKYLLSIKMRSSQIIASCS
jgi:hypothetical protein